MTKKREDVTVKFDHHASPNIVDPDYALAELRHQCPVAWTESHGGYWVATKHEDVSRVLKDHRVFTSGGGPNIPQLSYGETAMIDVDPPQHTKYRRAVNHLLAREVVEADLVPRIEYWTDLFIDRVIESGKADLLYDIAVSIPVAVTLEWLGWENQDEWMPFGGACHDLMARPPWDARYVKAAEGISYFDTRIMEEVELRRRQPRNDPIGFIGTMEIDGERIPDDDALSLIRVFVNAGIDTTTSVMGSALVHLHFHHDDRQRLIDDPELWDIAMDEFLRRFPPARNIARRCLTDTELGGCPIMEGESVLASVASANQDADAYAEPLEFVIDRNPTNHLSFGTGVHRCIGMHLARAEFKHILSQVLSRMPDYQIIEDDLAEYTTAGVVGGWLTAPATFTPGARVRPVPEAEKASA